MKSLNSCSFIGNLGSDPEVRYTGDGTAVANFSIACTEKWKDGEHTEWVRLVCWARLGEIAQQYLKKGDPIYVEGGMRTRKYQASDGSDRYSTEVRVNNLIMLGGKGGGEHKPDVTGKPKAPQREPVEGGGDGFFDDLPFNQIDPKLP